METRASENTIQELFKFTENSKGISANLKSSILCALALNVGVACSNRARCRNSASGISYIMDYLVIKVPVRLDIMRTCANRILC